VLCGFGVCVLCVWECDVCVPFGCWMCGFVCEGGMCVCDLGVVCLFVLYVRLCGVCVLLCAVNVFVVVCLPCVGVVRLRVVCFVCMLCEFGVCVCLEIFVVCVWSVGVCVECVIVVWVWRVMCSLV